LSKMSRFGVPSGTSENIPLVANRNSKSFRTEGVGGSGPIYRNFSWWPKKTGDSRRSTSQSGKGDLICCTNVSDNPVVVRVFGNLKGEGLVGLH
jgi:hypothetical protein